MEGHKSLSSVEGHKTLSKVEGFHRSVLLKEVMEALIPPEGGRNAWYLDATLGDGGHSIEIIKRGGRIVGIDQDPQALKRVRIRFDRLGISKDKYELIRGNFRDLKNLILEQADKTGSKFAGAIFDLGVSSMQLETPKRGFSFAKVGPLDMRMDPFLEVTALDLINAGGRKELYELFTKLGEEKFAKAIADTLVSTREIKGKRVKTTKDLADLVEEVYKKLGFRKWRIHPATRIFQALRIAVNDELNALEEGLNQVVDLTYKDGSIIVISFHSGEDRIVKNIFKEWQIEGLGKIITKKPIQPSLAEVRVNSRSRSAKMRAFKVY